MEKTNEQRDLVEQALEKVRPYIQMHGGDVTLHTISDGVVTLSIHGACIGCPLVDLTYTESIGSLLQNEVEGIREVRLSYPDTLQSQ